VLFRSQDYFLAGRRLPWYAIGFSLIATSISSEQFIAEVAFAYEHGLAVANWEWGVFPAMTLMILFFVPFYIRRQISTMPEWLEHRFGASSRFTFALIMVLSYVFVNLAGVLYTGGVLLHAIFNIDQRYAIAVLAVVTGVYTVMGGLPAVVWNDVIQAILLLGAGLLVFFLGLHKIGGWEAMRGVGERAHLMLPASDPDLPWTAILVGMLSTNLWYYATNQYINQRVLGARNEWHARAGIIFAGFLGIFLALAVCFPGLIAYRLIPGLTGKEMNEAYPRVVNLLVGPLGYGLRGLVLAGLMAAIMSTLDALMNSCSAILTIDFYQRLWKPSASDRDMIRVGPHHHVGRAAGGGPLDACRRAMGSSVQVLPGLLVLHGRADRGRLCLRPAVAPLQQLFRHGHASVVYPPDPAAGPVAGGALEGQLVQPGRDSDRARDRVSRVGHLLEARPAC
jgi:SSS family solute:Na+ symporter